MRHRVMGKRLGRTSSHRRALRRNLAASLIEHGAIRTTTVKAKEVRSFVEKLITNARRGTLHARRQVIAALGDRRMADSDGEYLEKTVVQKLFDEVAPRYAERPGGYTRIIRLAERRIGDAGEQVVLQLVEEKSSQQSQDEARPRGRRASRRAAAAKAAEQGAPADEPQAQAESEAQATDESEGDTEVQQS